MFPEIWREIMAAKPERLKNSQFERLVVLTETVHVSLLTRELRAHIPGESERRAAISQVVDTEASPPKKILRERRAQIAKDIAQGLANLKPAGAAVPADPAPPKPEAGAENPDRREEDYNEWRGLLDMLELLAKHAQYMDGHVTHEAFGPEPRGRNASRPPTGKDGNPANPAGPNDKTDNKPPAAPGSPPTWSHYEKFLRDAFAYPDRERGSRKEVQQLDDHHRKCEGIVWNETVLAQLLARFATALDELWIESNAEGWATVEQLQEAKRCAGQRVAHLLRVESPGAIEAWWQRIFPRDGNRTLAELGEDAARKFDEFLEESAANRTKDGAYKADPARAPGLGARIEALDPYFSVGLWKTTETRAAADGPKKPGRPGEAIKAVALQTQQRLEKLDEKLQLYAWWTKREGDRIKNLKPKWGDYGSEEAWRNAEREKYAAFSQELIQLCEFKCGAVSDSMALARRKVLGVRRKGFTYDHDNYVLGVAVDELEIIKVVGFFPVGPYCSVRLLYRPPADFPAEEVYAAERNSPNQICALLARAKSNGGLDDSSFDLASKALRESLSAWHNVAPPIGLEPTRHPKGIECLYYYRPSRGNALSAGKTPKIKRRRGAELVNSLVAGKKLINLGRSVLKFAALAAVIWAAQLGEVQKSLVAINQRLPWLLPVAVIGLVAFVLIYIFILAKWLFKNDVLVPQLRMQLDLIDLKLESHFEKSMQEIAKGAEALVEASVDCTARSLNEKFEAKREDLLNGLQGNKEKVELYVRQVARARASVEAWAGELTDIEWTAPRK